MAKKLLLPRVFEDRSEDQRYAHLNGLPKISYSQLTAWKDPAYRPGYIRSYFVGIREPSGIFPEYGSACGTWIESLGTGSTECHEPYQHLLSAQDREILTQKLDYPENSRYEDYIVLDINGEFVIEGFADRSIYLPDNKVIVEDFKTGSIARKREMYAGPDYNQTRLYAYAKELEGFEIRDCRVILLDRKGNGSEKHPIRLSGQIEVIPTPYDYNQTQDFVENQIRSTVHEISDHYQKYLKIFR